MRRNERAGKEKEENGRHGGKANGKQSPKQVTVGIRSDIIYTSMQLDDVLANSDSVSLLLVL